MKTMRLWVSALVAGLMSAGTVAAQDLTVIVTNRNYDRLPDVGAPLDTVGVTEAAVDAGFEVLALTDARARQLRQRFADRYDDLLDAERLAFVLTGHFVTDGEETWFLGTDATQRPDLFRVGAQGLRLGALLRLLEGKPGHAFLFAVPGAPGGLGSGLREGIATDALPQGVTVVEGGGQEMTDLLVQHVFGRNTPVGAALEDLGGAIAGYGYLPRRSVVVAEPEPPRINRALEFAAWRNAQRFDSAEAYRDYLDAYPDGRFSAEAEARLAELERSPEEIAAAEEADLGLTREMRRSIQRNLAILGHDPRGVDGIFGRGTRAAIRSWQAAEDLPPFGYLSGNQIARLEEAARQRSAELEEEARIRQEEEDRLDSAYWRETGQGQTEDGLRDYLEGYPDGLFSELARDRLADMEDDRRSAVRIEDQRAWDDAAARDTARGYRQYLQAFPNGAYADAAVRRLRELEGNRAPDDEVELARAEEAEVVANPITRLLVERRLEQLGLNPGASDGRFDEDTRRAVRQYQRARDLPVTGYVTQQTLVRLLAGN